MAGDTPAAQGVAAHLAGCPAARTSWRGWSARPRSSGSVVGEQAPADLRERTLAAVRAAGAPRTAPAAPAWNVASRPLGVAAGGRPGRPRPRLGRCDRRGHRPVGGGHLGDRRRAGRRAPGRRSGTRSTRSRRSPRRRCRSPPNRTPGASALAGADPALAGNIVFSPSTSELVVVATGLTPPPAGQEYRCWVEQAGDRAARRQDVLRRGPRLLGRARPRGRGTRGRGDIRGVAGQPRREPGRFAAGPRGRPLTCGLSRSDAGRDRDRWARLRPADRLDGRRLASSTAARLIGRHRGPAAAPRGRLDGGGASPPRLRG